MTDWIYLDHHTKARPGKGLAQQFAKEAESHWLIAPKEKAKTQIRELMGVEDHFLSLAASHKEAMRAIFFYHYKHSIRETGRTHILSPREDLIKELETFDVQAKSLALDPYGRLTKKGLQEGLRARSSLLSIALADPKTGVIQPVQELIEHCRENGVAVHLDVSAAVGKLYFQLSALDVDYVSLDGDLLGLPFPAGIIFAKSYQGFSGSYAQLSCLHAALAEQFDLIESYNMHTAHLRDQLETKLQTLGGQTPLTEVLRLPNVAVCRFPEIHAQHLANYLQKEGVFATFADPFSLSFALSTETTKGEIDTLMERLPRVLEKCQKKKVSLTEEDAKAKNMRLCRAKTGEEANHFELLLLIDEEDGVIADAQFSAFAPLELCQALEITCTELIRKNYLQAQRMAAELIEKQMSYSIDPKELNRILDAIDQATEGCMDIPIEDIYVAPPEMGGGERTEYPGWEFLSDEQKKSVIAQVMETEIQPYVELDAGGVEVLKVEENRVTIAYSGNCTSCHSATGATLDAIGNILRHKIYPDLMVIPDVSALNLS